MKSFLNTLFSSKIAMLFLMVFIIIIASATFIENIYDTTTAQQLIYKAKWFELFMLVMVILYISMMFRKNLLHIEKIPQLIFHFSFVLLFIGGGITRYFGFEANMHILENEAVKELYSVEPYLQIRTNDGAFAFSSDSPLYFSQIQSNNFHFEFDIHGGEKLEINYKNYLSNAKDSFSLYGTEEENIDYHFRNPDGDGPDALVVTIIYKDKTHDAILFYDDTKYVQKFKPFDLEGLQLEMVYGPKPISIPFALQLKDFTLSKYPGTNIPSASRSRVVLVDDRKSLREEHLIEKNKVLDYDGYRFFQTSYDDNEKGTILSVNYDYYGTRVTYFGYILMILGALLILFSKRTHFSQLDTQIKEVRAKRKSLIITIILVLGFSSFGFSQQPIKNPINIDHADRFGHLLVQTYDGRFSSVHSLATDVVHKITGKDKSYIEGKGTMAAMQLFLDILVDPEFWREQKIIRIREKSLRDILGVSGKYASFNEFYENNKYKLEDLAKSAFQKKSSEQSNLDREIIKVTERVNIFLMTLKGTMLKLFPYQNSENNEWLSWIDERSFKPLSGGLLMLNEDLKLKEFNYSNIMRTYLVSTISAREKNDYKISDKLLGYIEAIQRQTTPPEMLPSKTKIDLEVLYNKFKIFDVLKYVYALLGIVLLLLTFIENFKSRSNKKLQLSIKIIVGFIVAAFVFQTFGMGLRWFLGGHAPWSNGYEVLLLVAWGSMLAGFSVIKYSKITLAATALLAFLVLMTAGHSYYDPQLTNLNPVLKSVWLIIHVAVITIGYGFLALSFILGLVILGTFFGRSEKNKVKLSLLIQELTLTNEKLVVIGMLLTAIGTFIGCIWANESWGSYWSWNAKQTWSLIIVLVYGVVLHFKYIPGLQSPLAFNIGSMLSFGSVLMTFIGVNYYFTKGLHSYASDDPPIFPIWSWVAIALLFVLISAALWNERQWKRKPSSDVY